MIKVKNKYLDNRITFRISSSLLARAKETAALDRISDSEFYRIAIRDAIAKIRAEHRERAAQRLQGQS